MLVQSVLRFLVMEYNIQNALSVQQFVKRHFSSNNLRFNRLSCFYTLPQVYPNVLIPGSGQTKDSRNQDTVPAQRLDSPVRSNQRLEIRILCPLNVLIPRSGQTKDSKSENCVRVQRHVYRRIALSVSEHYTNPTKRDSLAQSGHRHHFTEM